MTDQDERFTDALMHEIGRELARADDSVRHHSEHMLRWLADDIRAAQSGAERERDERDAEAFVERVLRARVVQRARMRLPRHELRHRVPPVIAPASQVVPMAGKERCAALLDMSAAAGEGRELWDEPCESWVELPPEFRKGSYLALGVAGDSMTPVLGWRDVILVQLDARPAVDDVVVARLPDGYVVKRLAAMTAVHIELESFNADFAPILALRDVSSILGVVVARFTRTS